MLHDTRGIVGDTSTWLFQSWAAFAISTGAMLYGIWSLNADSWARAFLGLGFLFSVSSCFSLAKAIRDRHESLKLVNRISSAKAEKIINEHEMRAA